MSSLGVALALLLGGPGLAGAGKPDKPDKPGKPGNDAPKTQACVLSGEAEGGGTVGIDAKSFVGPFTVSVQGGELALTFAALGGPGDYVGLARVLKRQGYLDFTFNLPYAQGEDCRPIEFGDVMGPGLEGENVCQYHLQVLDGVFDRKGDVVTFTNAQVWLFDNWGATREAQKLSPDGARANLRVEFEE
jgi:hypothetical protein